MHELSDEQQEAVDRMVSEPTHAALCAAETGVGKTLMAIELAKALNVQTILVIAPIGTKVKTWKKGFAKQELDLPFRSIDSSREGQKTFHDLRANIPGIYFVGREFFHLSGSSLEPTQKKDGSWTPGREALWSWAWIRPDIAIFDEVQTSSNRDSNTFRILKTLHAEYKLSMSATPQGNKFQGLWSVGRWLWPTARDANENLYVDKSFWRWAAEWAVVVEDFYSGKKVTEERIPGAFVKSLPCYIRIEADRFPIEPRPVFVDLTPTQRRMYDQMEQDALTWLGEHPLVADLPITKRIRLRQITLGEVTFNDDGDVDFADDAESSKIEALEKILDLHPNDPILVLLDSRKFAKVVARRLGPKAVAWTGDASHTERNRILDEFGKSVQYIIATIPAISEGTDGLQRICNIEVWMSKSLNNMLNIQAEGRINRRGLVAEKVISYTIQARNTDDDGRFEDLVKQTRNMRASLIREAS